MVKRELYLSRIRPFYESEMIKVLVGIRRCGKSTILGQIMQELEDNGVAKDMILYINFENYKYHMLTNPDDFFNYVENKLEDASSKFYLLFDEIQNVDKFELVLNSFRATHNVSIFITGSNSKLLSGELATHLSGRTVTFKIRPFNFLEFCKLKKEESVIINYDQLLEEYIKWGGFPLVCKEENTESKEVLLSNIYDAVVLKDIILRNGISSPLVLEKLLNYIIANSGLTVSGNAISGALGSSGCKASAPVIYDLLKAIQDACICENVPRYDIRGKKFLAFEQKAYVCDLGFFHMKKNRVKQELNYIAETLVFNELKARGFSVYIGKTYHGEIDFIAEKDSKKCYIQVAYLLADESTRVREFGAYTNIKDNYPKYVISFDRITQDCDGIIHFNILDFLLNENSI